MWFYFIWLKYLSWFYYGNEALVINQWEGAYLSCGVCNQEGEIETVDYDECEKYGMAVTGDMIISTA